MTVAFGRAATLAVLFWVSVRGLVCDCRLRSRRLLNCVSRSVLRSCPVGLHFQSWVVVPVPLTCCRCSLGFRPPVWPWSRPGGFAVVSPSCRLIPTHPLVCTRPSHSASCAAFVVGFSTVPPSGGSRCLAFSRSRPFAPLPLRPRRCLLVVTAVCRLGCFGGSARFFGCRELSLRVTAWRRRVGSVACWSPCVPLVVCPAGPQLSLLFRFAHHP